MKKHLLFASVCSIALFLSACGSKEDTAEKEVKASVVKQEETSSENKEVESESESQTEEETEKVIETLEIMNNGKTVVQYGSDIYYWKYNNGSFEHQALLANYNPVSTAQNQLICRKEDGSEEEILTACAMGNLYIMDDKLYFESLSFTEYTYSTEVKWIEKEGEKWNSSVINSLGAGKIAAVDKEKNVILFLTDSANSQYHDLYIINSKKQMKRQR